MAQQLPRKTLKVFGGSGGTSNFGQFGSQAASAPLETKDISTIQSLAAWDDGWQDAVALGQAPYLQDMNGVMYVHSYEIAYILTEGIPEYDSSTTYDAGSVVRLPYTGSNNFQIFVSLGDSNAGNALPTAPASNAHWQFVMGFVSSIFTFGEKIGFGSNSTEGLVGTATNDDPPAGCVGERFSSAAGLTNAPTSTQWGDLTSISLTAGDWDVDALVDWALNGATMGNGSVGISTTTGNSATGLTLGDTYVENLPPQTSANNAVAVTKVRMLLAAPATVYLKYMASYSLGTPKAAGRLTARRVR